MNRRLLFVVNVDWFFFSHRLPIALAAKERGYEIHLATEFIDHAEALSGLGFHLHPLRSMRGPVGMVRSLTTILAIVKLFVRIKPDIVHLVTVRPVVLGGVAARIARVPSVLSAVSGLGYVFLDTGTRATLRRAVVSGLYSIAFRHRNIRAVFQNRNDRDDIVALAGLSDLQADIIRGSGVDLEVFVPSTPPPGVPVVMLAARLLRDKGVFDFVAAARLLQRTEYAPASGVRCVLVGDIDPGNPASLSSDDLSQIVAEAAVEVWGPRTEMQNILPLASVIVLPSYREGLPRVLIEAAACGRAVVTTDVPGCRDAVDPDVTGLLVPPRDPESLARAVRALLDDPFRRAAMGRAGRALAERSFDIREIVDQHLSIYSELMHRASA